MCKDRPKRGFYHLKEFDLTSTRESHRVVTRFVGSGITRPKKSRDQGSQPRDLESQRVGSGSALFFVFKRWLKCSRILILIFLAILALIFLVIITISDDDVI